MTDATTTTALPDGEAATQDRPRETREPGFLVICWNDPVNLMSYVTHVFQRVFGWNRQKAERHMLEVHHQGRSLLTRERFERAEFYVHRLQSFRLQATLEKDDA